MVEVGKCAVEVDYIGIPWRDFGCMKQPPPMGNHIKNRDKRLNPEIIEARKIEEVFKTVEQDLADYAMNTPHSDTLLVRDLHEGKINMPALITLAVNQVLLCTDAAVMDRRALDSSGRYNPRWFRRMPREGPTATKPKGTTEEKRRRKAEEAKTNSYQREYTKKRNRGGGETEHKSINRDPQAPVWLTKRRGAKKINIYTEMINSILPHHPDGEEDDDDKRAERIRLKNSSSSSSLASAASTTDREQSRVGAEYQALVPMSTAAGSAGGLSGAATPDPAGAGDTIATVSTLVSTTEKYQDPTAADQADQSVSRFNIVYNEAGDSDFDYPDEDTCKPWSKVKRAVKFRKTAMAAKRSATRAAGIILDEASSHSDSNSEGGKTNAREEVGKSPIKGINNIQHLLLQGAVPMETDEKDPKE